MFSIFNIISFIISFAFPLITTYKAINANDTNLLKPWIIYWVVYSLLTTMEFQLYSILSFIPLYTSIKLYISIWLILPQTQGSLFLYHQYLEPFISHYEADFDRLVNEYISKDPIEIVLSLLKSRSLKSSAKAKEVEQQHDADLTKSYFDIFAQSFYQNSKTSTKDSPASGSNNTTNIFESLFGVLATLGNDNTPVTSASSNDNDYDVVGNEEYENIDHERFGKSVEGTPTKQQSTGWFSNWWVSADDATKSGTSTTSPITESPKTK